MLEHTRWIRAITRIELRSALSNGWRTLLIMVLIGIPVAAIVAGNNLLYVTRATPIERSVKAMGRADLRIKTKRSVVEIANTLPAGSKLEPVAQRHEEIILNGLRLSVDACRLDLNGLASGIRRLVDGDIPIRADEVALTGPLLQVGGFELGDLIELSSGKARIVGTIEDSEDLEKLGILYPLVDGNCTEQSAILVKLPSDAKVSLQDLSEGEHVITRETAANEMPPDAALVFVVGGFGLAEAALIVAAAFIVGIRRRQREIGLIASAGASRFQVLISILMSATFASLLSVICALGLGLLVSWMIHPYLDHWNGRRNGPFEICWSAHLLAAMMGVFTAVLSALIPAISASRMPIKEALSSRRPIPGLPVRSLSLGIIVLFVAILLVVNAKQLAIGMGWREESSTLLVMLGSVLGVFGIGICCPWILVVISKCSTWLPLPWRLAIRETGRFRTRNGPIIASIVAGMALSVTFASIYKSVLSLDHDVTQMFGEDQVLVVGPAAESAARKIIEELDGQVPSASIAKVTILGRPVVVFDHSRPNQTSQIGVWNKDILATLGVKDKDGAIQSALERGVLLSLTKDAGSNASLRLPGSKKTLASPQVVSIDARRIGPIGYLMAPNAMVNHNWTSRRGVMGRDMETRLVRLESSVDRSLLTKAAKVAAQFPATTVTAQCEFKPDRSQLLSFFFVTLLSGLFVTAVATALASAESQSDQRILATVGAPPSVSRHQSAARSAFLALLGCILAIPAGMLPAWGILNSISRLEFAVPWIEVLFIATILPSSAYALTYLGIKLAPGQIRFE